VVCQRSESCFSTSLPAHRASRTLQPSFPSSGLLQLSSTKYVALSALPYDQVKNHADTLRN
jgi:hypothetical protein